ncbi:MAG: protease modulator HflC [Spirochaetota bacterium]
MKKVKKGPIIIVILVIILIIVALQFIYVVREDEQVVLLQFGEIMATVNDGDKSEAGLHWKAPWIEAKIYSKKIRRWDGDPDLIPTRPDNQKIFIDTTARWRIVDPHKYYRRLRGDLNSAASRLDDIIDGAVRNVIRGSFFIQVVASDSDMIEEYFRSIEFPIEIEPDEFNENYLGKLQSEEKKSILKKYYKKDENSENYVIKEDLTREETKEITNVLILIQYNVDISKTLHGRNHLENQMLDIVKENTFEDFGIDILDVIIKRVDYSDANRQAAYDRMIAERRKTATEKRAIGSRIQKQIEGEITRFEKEEESKAYEVAETLRGEGDARAAEIYAKAYSNVPEDLEKGINKEEFYEFYKLLRAYESLSEESGITISTDSDFYRLLKDMNSEFSK